MKNYLKRTTTFFLAILMLVSVPLQAFANVTYGSNKAEIINQENPPLKVAKLKEGETASDLIKNPGQPAIYTLRIDYKVQKGEKYEIDYQPYIASVGGAAKPDEQKKVNKEITLPDLAGYDKSHLDDTYKIDYETVMNAGENGRQEFRYKAKSNDIKIKHLFQDMKDFTKYTNPGGEDKPEKITTQNGNTGSTMEVSPLNENDRRGFIPEAEYITMQVPEDATDFVLEYRYNRAHYNVDFDTMGGTPIATRTYYYDQEIPKIEKENIPTKVGCDFLGWKPSHDLQTTDGKTYKANQIIKKADGNPALDLDVHLKMPALLLGKDEKSRERLKFTAVWKDKEKADYAIQFWAEKADHADDAGLEKYDYIGTRVYKDQITGSRPDLDNVPVDKIVFPDLDQARLQKIWNGDLFYGDQYPYINKFYVYNKDLTHDQNKDPKNVNLVKSVDATGRTIYNIYYDRQVYDLYFTKSNKLDAEETFVPEIYVPDGKGGAKLAGGPGNLYHFKARFNQLMLGWPNDAMQTKGFTPGKQSYGWGPNYGVPNWPLHLDTPPYRLNADEFLDMPNYENWGGYVSQIDKGDGSTIDVKNDPRYKDEPYKALSFGIKQADGSMPHHMDFWMDGFKDGETIIRYDLYRSKADTNDPDYGHRYSKVQGFTPKGSTIEEGREEHGRITEDDIDALNEEREGITPLPDKEYMGIFGFNTTVGQMNFMHAFFNNADPFGDPLDGDGFETNGYIRFKYKRNKYPLRFNYDPSKIKDDSEFNEKNSLDTFYEFPLKVLNPKLVSDDIPREEREYFKDNPKNLLDDPKSLQTLGLTDLVFTDPKDGKLKVKRPDGLSDQMVFKGWALDPAGSKLVWENPKETMPTHPLNLYAKWGEPDYKWKVTFDPDGGKLKTIKEEKLTTERKKIQEGDIGQEEVNTYAKKGYLKEDPTTPDGKQIFTVIQRQKLVEPVKPEKKGYDFMGWEVVRYKKDDKGDYTDQIDTSYRDKYGVPELYTFGNDVVGPIYLKAIWVPNQRVDVKVVHHFLDKDCKKDGDPLVEFLENKRTGYYTATTGDKQGEKWILAPNDELINSQDQEIKDLYKKYNDNFGFNNTYFQNQRIEPEKIKDPNTGEMIDNPAYKGNEFHFFYRPFRQREYKVNYIDERFKDNPEKGKIIDQELVTNGNRHYDARNYRPIPGWKLVSAPQQQLFFDVNEETNEFLGINGTGKDEITFYYKDVRVIEVPNKDDPVPDGYVRVTFKADKGGAFTDKDGNSKTELYYDVIKGLKSDLLPVPQELKDGEEKVADKYYITPDTGKKFTKWDKDPLLNKNTIINENHTFTAYFEWSGLSATGLVRTEAFKDPKGTWTNNFAPTIDQLKAQLVWKEKDQVKDLPAGTEIKLFYTGEDGIEKEITTNDQVYDLVTEKKAADKDELVRTVNVKAKVTFKDGKEPQELTIPITVYKNVYEALNKEGDKPLFLTEAEGKDAKDGGLKDVTGNYVKVTVQPTEKNTNKDVKVYYVNPKAWVNIPEIEWSQDDKDKTDFLKWTADKDAQNENGVYDFAKRHKFTEDTVISSKFAKDVVEQKQGEDKPKVPDNFVKVIVKTTDKATSESTQTFWVNPTKEVTIPVTEPTGKENQKVTIDGLGEKTVNYIFKEWQKVQTGEADDSLTKVNPVEKIELASHKYTDKVTVIEAAYKKSIQPGKIENPLKTTKLDTPQGKEITNDDLIKQITPQEGKEIASIEVISKPDGNTVGDTPAKVIVKYKDGTTQGTNDDPVVIPVEVHENIIPAGPNGEKPEKALDNYVKIIFKAGEGGSLSGDLVYYVSPEVEVDMTESAGNITKKPDVGYISGDWDTSETKKLKATFTAKETEFTFNFTKTEDIVEKIDENTKKPEGYVTVKLIPTDKATDPTEKVYFVNPKAKNVTITNKPEGKNETVGGIEYTYVFNGWTVTKGTVASWANENINGKFTQDTEITAKYLKKVGLGDLIPAPVPKKDLVIAKGDTPKPEDLIKNVPGSENDPLPEGTTFKYTDDGTPDISNPGKTTAKVEVKYPNGKTVVVEVPITVVDNVVPQVGNDKPLVPESYVKVTVDTTDKATDNTKFTKVFWVKPGVEVTIPDILAPTGKTEIIDGVTKKNNFVKWQLEGTPEKTYGKEIKDTFTAKESKIIATYEFGKNVEAKGKNNQWIPQGSNPLPKDFIENPYNDDDPNNKDNLPSGTKIEFVKGKEPDTKTPGKDKETTIKITYPNGETKEVPVKYNVIGDVVEQKDGENKPAVPDNYVKVIVDKTDKAQLLQGEQQTQTFWVNPRKEVTIPARDPEVKDDLKKDNWKFSRWNKPLTGIFTKETPITAIFGIKTAPIVPQPNVKYVITDVDVQPTKDKYLDRITPPFGKVIDDIQIVNKPDVSKRGESVATIKVDYKDGTSAIVKINVIVQDKNMPPTPEPEYPNEPGYPSYPGGPIPMYPEVRYETIIQEKIVKVPVPVTDNYFKEVRYMQGFNGYFRPNDGLTRAEAAQILANALVEDGYKYNPNFKISYKDIGEAWYTRAVKIVTEANVFAGYDDGNFKPQAKITRNEWIATLKRFQELGDASGNNMNLSDNHWAKGEIQAALNEGWLKIYTDGLATYKGDEFIPRQEVASVSNKAFKRIVDKTYIGKNNLSLVTYKDVNTSMWAYEDILCASNTFLDRKDRYIAHWVKEDKNQFNIDTSDFKIVQKNFQRNPR